MKKINFFFLFLISVAPMLAHADWIQVGLGKGTSLYLETTKTAPIDSSSKRAVTLLSFESKQQVANRNPYFSAISRIEADCRNLRYRTVAMFYYSEPMGKGDLVDTDNIPLHQQEWKYPAPNSAMDEAINEVCKKR